MFASCDSTISIRKNKSCLQAKTSTDGDFSVLMLPQEQNWLRTFQSDIVGESTGFLIFLLKNGLENFLEVLE